MFHKLFAFITIFFASILGNAKAEDFILWQSTNVQLLRGFEYEVGSDKRTIATFEHANSWIYGDFFMFVDQTWPNNSDSAYYAEISPRLSISKITGNNLSYGIIKDILISMTIEKPEYKNPRYLYGGALGLDVTGFKFFNANMYIRDDPDFEDQTWQVTLSWNRPFEVQNTSWVVEGFADFAGDEGNYEANQLIVPRLLLDVGELIDVGENNLWMGVEYSYWHNKFGINGKTESVPQIQVKWVF